MKFSVLAETTEPSETLRIDNQVKQQIQDGKSIFNFTIGDYDPAIFPIPKELEDEIVSAYRNHLTSYPQAEGNADLRKAIKRYTKDYQGIDYEVDEILVASGGRPLIYAMYMALCDKGDRIVYPVPSWNNQYYTHFAGGDAIIIETKEENKFMPTAAELEPVIKDATLIALCSPQNPTGTIFTEDQLKSICDMVVEENKRRTDDQKKLYILFDQMYAQLVYGTAKHFTPAEVTPEVKPFTITIDAISKSFAATGIRVGWCMGPAALIAKMRVLLTHVGSWAPMPEQKGLAKYLHQKKSMDQFLTGFRYQLDMRLQFLYKEIMLLKERGYPIDAIAPQAAIFLSIRISLLNIPGKDGTILKTTEEVTQFLLEKAGLAIIPFYAFGDKKNDTWYRLSVGTSRVSDLEKMLFSLSRALQNFIAAGISSETPCIDQFKKVHSIF